MKTPSVLLIVTGVLTILSGFAPIAIGLATDMNALIAGGVLGLFNFIGGAFILFGGLKANKLESRTLVMAACIAACLPTCSMCCMPLGLIAGIWGLVTANKLKDEFNS